MEIENKEALQVVETVKMAGRIYEDARNHVWYVPTTHPIFSALPMVAGPVSRQIESGSLSTGIDGARRYAEVSAEGEAFRAEFGGSSDIRTIDRSLTDLLYDAENPTT